MGQKLVVGLEDFEGLEYNFENNLRGLDFDLRGQNFERIEIKMELNCEKCEKSSSTIKLGTELVLRNQDKIKKANSKIKNRRNKLKEKLEFAAICNVESGRVLKEKFGLHYNLSRKFIYYFIERSLFVEGSLLKVEQMNIKYRKLIRLNFVNQMMAQLLFKKHIYGFINKTERLFLKELQYIQKLCLE